MNFTKTVPLSTINMITPDDFPDSHFEAIQARLVKLIESHNDVYMEYAGAFNAVAYRYIACTNHNSFFTDSIIRRGSAPPQPDRFIQEQELFYFFVTGLATIDSFCYGLYAIASILKPLEFPFKTDGNKKDVTIGKTSKYFEGNFGTEKISKILKDIYEGDDFKNWKTIRNTLTHRISPGRKITIVMGEGHSAAVRGINDIIVDKDTTSQRHKWLSKTLKELFEAADDFTRKYFM